MDPAAFRRLCVETLERSKEDYTRDPAAFRRLCVETAKAGVETANTITSRLQAAVC